MNPKELINTYGKSGYVIVKYSYDFVRECGVRVVWSRIWMTEDSNDVAGMLVFCPARVSWTTFLEYIAEFQRTNPLTVYGVSKPFSDDPFEAVRGLRGISTDLKPIYGNPALFLR